MCLYLSTFSYSSVHVYFQESLLCCRVRTNSIHEHFITFHYFALHQLLFPLLSKSTFPREVEPCHRFSVMLFRINFNFSKSVLFILLFSTKPSTTRQLIFTRFDVKSHPKILPVFFLTQCFYFNVPRVQIFSHNTNSNFHPINTFS